MIWFLVRAAGLTSVYLMVMTSVAPGDILVGALLALAVAYVARGAWEREAPSPARARIAASTVVRTAAEMALGSWRVVRFCLGAQGDPGFVRIPRDGRSLREVAIWGVLTGEAPDEYPVDLDDERDELIVHLVDAGDPEAVRARHGRARERWTRTAAD